MSYFGFLLVFLVIPILLALVVTLIDRRQGRKRAVSMRGWPVWPAIFLHVAVAVLYTTPWDNYLVATEVWWYDPALVTGLTIGWVPIEEYTFFVLQPILGSLWLLLLLRRLEVSRDELRSSLRLWTPSILGIFWLGSAFMLLSGWQPGTYLALELVWALPPIALQFAFGADLLWRHRRLLFWAIGPVTLFLSAADFLAIGWGTWTISAEKSLNIYLGGTLPLEEFIFFLLTNSLVIFGLTLIWAEVSHERLAVFKEYVSLKLRLDNDGSPNKMKRVADGPEEAAVTATPVNSIKEK